MRATAAIQQPTIDAVEIDGDKNYFAGSAPDGATVRLYVDDKFVADAVAAGGRWLVEAANVLVQHAQTIRIDVLQPGGSQVASRAEVNFVVDLPKARIAGIALGHDAGSHETDAYRQLLKNAILWAAGR